MPAQIKRSALNSAWVIKWNKASFGICIPSLAIITPNWLNVERAMIFFISDSIIAERPAINIVREATKRSVWWKYFIDERAG